MDIDGATILYRVGGATLGSLCALVIVEPATLSGFFKRGSVSLIVGLIFADVTADYLKWSMIVPNRIVAASFLSAMLGWWIADGVIRLARTRLGEYIKSAAKGRRE